MANTYELIASNTVGSGGTATVTFSGIPQTYTDLIIKICARSTRGGADDDIFISYNGTTTGYTYRYLQGYATNARSSNGSNRYVATMPASGATASTFGNTDIYIPNYTSSNYKSVSTDSVTENNSATAYEALIMTLSTLWSNTSAITSIALTSGTSNSFAQYSTFYLYGVTKSTETGTGSKAIGGTVTTSGSYTIHTFTSSGMFTPTTNVNVDYLVVAGGGGVANSHAGGGGGGGGLLTSTAYSVTSGTSYSVIVGAGGAGAPYSYSAPETGLPSSGSNSSFHSLVAIGGGGGSRAYNSGVVSNGQTGGSGGGGGGSINSSTGTGGAATSGQGYAGGYGLNVAKGGGGGGAGGAGGNAIGSGSGGTSGNGGAGLSNSYSGTSTYYSAGGIGGYWPGITEAAGTAGTGGVGVDTAGGANTGQGASSGTAQLTLSGGSGIVIVRYLT